VKSAKKTMLLALLALGAGLLGGCGRAESGDAGVTLTVFAAASLADALTEAGERFTAESGIALAFNFAGSGTLAQQLRAAPRADLFVSASEAWMDAVAAAGRLEAETRVTLLANSLVVIAHPEAKFTLDGPSQLAELPVAHFSLGDPAYVPAGRYARDWLEGIEAPGGGSVWARVSGQIVPAPDVRAALQLVAARRDVVGIVYRSDALARTGTVRILLAPSADEQPVIRYPAAILRATAHPAEARALLAFLRSPTAGEIFARHGFAPARND
jgi:molybdate transport system substrate-binding protein